MPLRRALPSGVLAAAVLLAGCTASGSAAGSAPTRSASPTPTVPPAVPTMTPSPSGPADEAPVLLLQGDGLGLVDGDGDTVPLPFGSPADAVRQAVEDTLGPSTTIELPDCPTGPRTSVTVDGFAVLLDGDRFVGWRETGEDDGPTTVDGLGVGSALDELQSALPGAAVVAGPDSTSWTSAGGLSGLLSGPDPAATVTAIGAGEVCASG